MWTLTATAAGDIAAGNEDYVTVGDDTMVVLDGLTARTDTGCIHGVGWYVGALANAILRRASFGPSNALALAIEDTAARHRQTCDLSHPGTPAAAVAIAQCTAVEFRYLVLCDTTLVLDTTTGITIVTDPRMGNTAPAERAAADASPVGTPEKAEALVTMKHAELAARNAPGGYWAASSDPGVANHAITGAVALDDLRRAALLTDGAARLVEPFRMLSWAGLLDLLSVAGPDELLRRTRAAEYCDPAGIHWPRNKKSDDATAVYFVPSSS